MKIILLSILPVVMMMLMAPNAFGEIEKVETHDWRYPQIHPVKEGESFSYNADDRLTAGGGTADIVFRDWQFFEKEHNNQIKVNITAKVIGGEDVGIKMKLFYEDRFFHENSKTVRGIYHHEPVVIKLKSLSTQWVDDESPQDETIVFTVHKEFTKSDKFALYILDEAVNYKGKGHTCEDYTRDPSVAQIGYSYYCKVIESDDIPYSSSLGGCLIATAAYGSEMAPQVQFLREIRDNTVLQTQSGTSFMTAFNTIYYSFSPTIADYERENPIFKETVKIGLTPLLTSLTILNYVDIDTEQEMLGYGIGIILLNIGMYFVAPAVVIIALKKRFQA